jgi:cyclohexyl-isocyanide hydratase
MTTEIKKNWNIGFLIFRDLTPLDLIGPYEVITRAFNKCFLVAETKELVLSNTGLKLVPDESFSSCPPLDILVVPGGPGQTPAMENEKLIEFIRQQSKKVKYLASVCTGTLLLAKADLLNGKRATTHWLAKQELTKYNSTYIPERVVWEGNIITGAGVSAGIDLSLELIEKIFGKEDAERIQLAIEYDPKPPYDCGTPDKATPHIVELLKSTSRFHKKN